MTALLSFKESDTTLRTMSNSESEVPLQEPVFKCVEASKKTEGYGAARVSHHPWFLDSGLDEVKP